MGCREHGAGGCQASVSDIVNGPQRLRSGDYQMINDTLYALDPSEWGVFADLLQTYVDEVDTRALYHWIIQVHTSPTPPPIDISSFMNVISTLAFYTEVITIYARKYVGPFYDFAKANYGQYASDHATYHRLTITGTRDREWQEVGARWCPDMDI